MLWIDMMEYIFQIDYASDNVEGFGDGDSVNICQDLNLQNYFGAFKIFENIEYINVKKLGCKCT